MLRPPLSRGTLRRHAVVATALAVIALPLIASTAAADQYFHTSHADLSPIGNAPLESGFVTDIHAQGMTISAQERYHLVGAMPNMTYTVALKIYVGDPAVPISRVPVRRRRSTRTRRGQRHGRLHFLRSGDGLRRRLIRSRAASSG